MGTKITKNGYLTVHDVTGPVSEVEMYDALERFYKQEPSALLLWDMSQADVSHVTSEILQKFVKKSAELEVSRQGGGPQSLRQMICNMDWQRYLWPFQKWSWHPAVFILFGLEKKHCSG